MTVDRVVVTTFPGYFFSTILCLESVRRWVPNVGIDIIIDDFGLDSWPTYVTDCQNYIKSHYPENINYYLFSEIPSVDQARAGGWFRQQLIKLHLDQLLVTDNWMLIDADVVLKANPNLDMVPVYPHNAEPVNIGNRNYVKHLLAINNPWLDIESPTTFFCTSGIPIRHLSRELLTTLRSTVEEIHNRNFLELHLELIEQQQIVAYDPAAEKMIMSEFQLIEVFRNRMYGQPLPFSADNIMIPDFHHNSIKDWNLGQSHFSTLSIPDQYWKNLMDFSRTYI